MYGIFAGYQPDLEIDPKYLPTPGVAPIPKIVTLPWWAEGGPLVDIIIEYTGTASSIIGIVALGAAAVATGAGAPVGGNIVLKAIPAMGL